MKPLLLVIAGAVLAAAPLSGAQLLSNIEVSLPVRTPDVVYVPTPQPVVEAMLRLAKVSKDEMVYDLGCGDGRAVITAARDFGARGVGVDIDPQRIRESRSNAEAAGVTDRVSFRQEDLFQMNFSDADVVFLYLLPALNVKLRPKILELRPGTRIVSHAFSMGDWDADETKTVEGRTVYHWVVPAKVDGQWEVKLPEGESVRLDLEQQYQKVDGTVQVGGESVPLTEGRVAGDTLTFTFAANGQPRTAQLVVGNNGEMKGKVRLGQASSSNWVARRVAAK